MKVLAPVRVQPVLPIEEPLPCAVPVVGACVVDGPLPPRTGPRPHDWPARAALQSRRIEPAAVQHARGTLTRHNTETGALHSIT